MKNATILCLSLLLVAPRLMAAWPNQALREPVKIVKMDEPVFPRDLLQYGVSDGIAKILVNINDEGVLVDSMVVGYSHKQFADVSVAAMKNWKFTPAKIDGRPIGVTTEMRIVFEGGQVLVQLSVNELLTSILYRFEGAYGYQLPTLAELDRIPVPQLVESPYYPTKLKEKGIGGEALVEFIIDETGAVRMPSVVRADHIEFAEMASEAVRRWKFEPPLRKGRPVAVRVQQTFNFKVDEGVPAAVK